MRTSSHASFGVVVIVIALAGAPSCVRSGEQPGGPRLPRRIVAIGDSITRATNACCIPGDQPGASWSVGDAGGDGVTSHLERLRLASDRDVRVRAFNVARAGARVADARRQARAAVRLGADYVTILLGANDACRSPMTPADAFEERFEAAIDVLDAGRPGVRIFVASIPNVVRLWSLFRDDPTARSIWETFATCPSVLSAGTTEADRRAVLHRIRAYNAVLRTTCHQLPRCRFDGGAVFRYGFGQDEVSSLDRFHPSVEGQAALAQITWPRSWWA